MTSVVFSRWRGALAGLALGAVVATGLSGCVSVDYIGETRLSTNHVDVYYSESDIGRPFRVLGQARAEADEDVNAAEIQTKLIAKAREVGADAVIIEGLDMVRVGETSSFSAWGEERGRVTQGRHSVRFRGESHISGFSDSSDIRAKVVQARFIVYLRDR